jgi:hypothetical protein
MSSSPAAGNSHSVKPPQNADNVRRDHSFKSPPLGIQTFCAYCMQSDSHHRPVSPEVRVAAEFLRNKWPGVFSDGGGMMALQDSETTAYGMLEAVAHLNRPEP